MHLSGQTCGYGVLVVTGNCTMSGQGSWHGYIICLGEATCTGGGSGFHLYGTVFIGRSSGIAYTNNLSILGQSDLYYSGKTVENTRTEVRTVQIRYWRSVASK